MKWESPSFRAGSSQSFTLALLLLLAGKRITQRVELLRRYSIPEPLAGGVLCAAAVALAWYALDLRIEFELGARDLLLYFFAGIGLKSDVRTLLAGGRPLLVLSLVATLFMPTFVSCLIAGILVRNLPLLARRGDPIGSSSGTSKGLALISDISLGLFLTMALMGLQLWSLQGMVGFVLVAMAVQVLLASLFSVFVVFRAMGRDYEASVICAGFSGIALGSTATAVANMTAVTQQYGAAHRAFVVVPLVCGFFVDLANALIIGSMLALQ